MYTNTICEYSEYWVKVSSQTIIWWTELILTLGLNEETEVWFFFNNFNRTKSGRGQLVEVGGASCFVSKNEEVEEFDDAPWLRHKLTLTQHF